VVKYQIVMVDLINKLFFALMAFVVVQSPVYFDEPQHDREIVRVALSPSPSPSLNPSSLVKPSPSLSPTPLPIESPIPIVAELETDYGKIRYKEILHDMWAVSYDSSCEGCSDITATGMKQGYGVVAVDPKVIPLYTRVYVPGYGIGIAGDVGGGVKGKIIDLGYDKLEGQWSARWVDVYILADED